jgi:hypothetical protein
MRLVDSGRTAQDNRFGNIASQLFSVYMSVSSADVF